MHLNSLKPIKIMKNLLSILCFFGSIICSQAQPGYDYTKGKEKIAKITLEITKDPKNLKLYEERLSLYSANNDYISALKDIDFLLSKDKKNPKYLFQKSWNYMHAYGLEKAMPFYKTYFEFEKDPFRLRQTYYYVGTGLKNIRQFDNALQYQNAALAINYNYPSSEDINDEKIAIYDSLKDYQKAQEMIEARENNDFEAFEHNLEFIKDYQSIKNKIIKYFESTFPKENNAYQINENSQKNNYWYKYVLYLSYVEYKLGNKQKAFQYLNFVSKFGQKVYILDCDMRFWCMVNDFGEIYQQNTDFQMLIANIFITDGNECYSRNNCVPTAFKNNKEDYSPKRVYRQALTQIETAKKLGAKDYYCLEGQAYYKLENYEKAVEVLSKAILFNSNDEKAYLYRHLANSQIYKWNNKQQSLDTDHIKYGELMQTTKIIHLKID